MRGESALKSALVSIRAGCVVIVVPSSFPPPLTETKISGAPLPEPWDIMGAEAIPNPRDTPLVAPPPESVKRPAPVLYVFPPLTILCIASAYRRDVPVLTQGLLPA